MFGGGGWFQVQSLYARTMNKIVFDEHLADPAQADLRASLDLPEREQPLTDGYIRLCVQQLLLCCLCRPCSLIDLSIRACCF